MAFSVGRVVGDGLEIMEELALGKAVAGFGPRFRARELGSGHSKLMCVIDADLVGTGAAFDAFMMAVQPVAALEDANLLGYRSITREGDDVLAMHDWVDSAKPLSTMLAQGADQPLVALAIARAMAKGLASIHAAGQVHGCLTPDSVWLAGERVRLSQYGIAAGCIADRSLAHFNARAGDARVWAPEITKLAAVSPASDVYDWAITTLQLLRGVESARETRHWGLRELEPSIGHNWAALLERCLALRMGERPEDGDELSRELARVAVPEHIVGRAPPRLSPRRPASSSAQPAGGGEDLEDFSEEAVNWSQAFSLETLRAAGELGHLNSPDSVVAARPVRATTTFEGEEASAQFSLAGPPPEPPRRRSSTQPTAARSGQFAGLASDVGRVGAMAPRVESAAARSGEFSRSTGEFGRRRGTPLVLSLPLVAVFVFVGLGAWAATRNSESNPDAAALDAGKAAISEQAPSPSSLQAASKADTKAKLPSERSLQPAQVPAPAQARRVAGRRGRGAAPAAACPRDALALSSSVCIDVAEYPRMGALPLTDVTRVQASLLCQRRGARLCTANEWQRACRGGRGRGEPVDVGRACNTATTAGFSGQLQESGSADRCRSRRGVFDLVGNAAEWVAEGRAMGGDATTARSSANCSYSQAKAATERDPYVGFRCCHDAPAVPE